MTDKTSLLPAHLSELERDLDAALARIDDVDIPIATLWNPWECPLDALPYLAWAMSVDLWRSDWSEKIKRQVVADSLSVHRRKGTRPAVAQALSSLGVETEFTEWFEASPRAQPGTFELIAWVNENLTSDQEAFLNQALYDQIRAGVANAKNARSHFTFKVGAKFGPSNIGVANAITGVGAMARRDSDAIQEPLESSAGIGMAMAGDGANLNRQTTQATIDAKPKPTAMLVATVCRGWSVIHKRMEATT